MDGGAYGPSDKDAIEPGFGLKRDITAYLSRIGFADRVMTELLEIPRKTRKTLIWACFCLANFFLLVIFGTNPSFISEFFALREDLAQFHSHGRCSFLVGMLAKHPCKGKAPFYRVLLNSHNKDYTTRINRHLLFIKKNSEKKINLQFSILYIQFLELPWNLFLI